MFNTGQELFMQDPRAAAGRVLCVGEVIENSENQMLARFDEVGSILESGQDVLVYFQHQRTFMQQAMKIEAMLSTDEAEPVPAEALVHLVPNGEPVSAESRQCYRVSTVISNYTIDIAQQEACKLLDVSVSGFSARCDTVYAIGSQVPVTLIHQGKQYAGNATVQSIKAMPDGQTRYGLHCGDQGLGSSSLAQGLRQLSMTVQREQARRLAGA